MKYIKMQWLILSIASIGFLGAQEVTEQPSESYGLAPLKEVEKEKIRRHSKRVIHVKRNRLARQRALLSGEDQAIIEEGGLESEPGEFSLMEIPVEDAELMLGAEDALPSSVNNSLLPSFPPIGNQGNLGSCVAWASTYYQATHEIGLLNGNNNKTAKDHVLSPKWTYDILNGGRDSGLSPLDACDLLASNGAPSILKFPYDTNYLAWSLNGQDWFDAIYNRMADFALIPGLGGTSQNLTAIKTALANGHVLTISTYANSWVYSTIKSDPENLNNKYVGQRAITYMNGRSGGHHLTIVGYDDTLWIDVNGNGSVDSGERGAFLLANSWGSSWGNRGFVWVSYDAFLSASKVVGGPSTGRISFSENLSNQALLVLPIATHYSPSLVAVFSVTGSRRSELAFKGGLSSTSSTTPTSILNNHALTFNGGSFNFTGTTSTVPTTIEFAMDFSDFLGSVGTTAKRFYISASDTYPGNPTTVNSFILKDLVHGKEIAAIGTPVTIDNTSAQLFLDYDYSRGVIPAVDTPVVNISAPASGATINGTTTVSAKVTGTSPITSVTLSVDSVPMGAMTLSGTTYSIALDTTKISNGNHTLVFTATNYGGKIGTATRAVNVSNVDIPVISVVSPTGSGAVSGTVPLSVLATSSSPITSVSLTVDSIPKGNMTLSAGKYGLSLDTTTLSNGAHTLVFTATNSGGKTNTATTTINVMNAQPPVITLVTPTNGSTVQGTIPLSVKVTSVSQISSVALSVDSNPIGNLILSNGNYGTSIDTTLLSNGSHTFLFTATNVDNKIATAILTINVQNVDVPAIAVVSPDGGSTVSGSVPLSVKVTGNTPISTVSLTIDSVSMGNLTLTNGNYGITVDTTMLSNGSHTFQVTARNSGGKTATATVTLNVANFDVPIVNVLSPAKGDTVKEIVPLSVQVVGDTPISSVALTVDSTSMGNLILSNGSYVASLDTTQLSDGSHTLKFVATNVGGKTASATLTVNVSNVDTPTLAVLTPANGASLNGTVPFSVQVTGTTAISSVALTVDSTSMGNLILSNGTYGISVDTTKLSNGSHTLKFVATNVGGKTATATLTVNVSNVDTPVLTVTAPTNGATLSGTASLSVKVTGTTPISSVALTVDSTSMGNLTLSNGTYGISLDTTKLSNGSHTLKFVATNSGGKTATATKTVTVSNVVQSNSYFVNVGGDALTSGGQNWISDAGLFTGTTTTESSNLPFADPIYQTARYGNMKFTFNVPNGKYNVKLKFAELVYQKTGSRLFSVTINGKSAFTLVDLVKRAGYGVPYDASTTTTVSNGTLTIELKGNANLPVLNGLEIVPVK